MEQGTRSDTPAMRLLRLWLWASPLAMLALATAFAVVAVDGEDWALLAAMVVLGVVALALFVLQWRLLRRPGGSER